jgi:hypothetical protein
MTSPDLPASGSHAVAAPPASGRVSVSIRTQSELVAAIPALMGFHPRDSLVVLAIVGEGGSRLGLTLRIDLPPPEVAAEVAPDLAAAAVRTLLRDSPSGAVVVVVAAGGGGPGDTGHGGDLPHGELVAHVVRELDRHAVEIHAAMWAEATTGGARWRCYDECDCSGVLPDPASTPVLAAAVAGGQVVHADRGALERLVAPADHERIRRRERLLIEATDTGADPEPSIGLVDDAVAAADDGRLVLDDERVVALAIALADLRVRDAALLRCLGPRPAAAEHLWAALARETPDPEAAEPAALLVVSALLRGDGALANVALDRAEQAWPGHRLTRLLRAATESGLRPSEIRAWLAASAEPAP